MAIVSVLIPVYNVEKYLKQCLDSVIGQTFSDIEIICVDDGSTDRSASILKKYAKKDKRIKIITKNNGGLPSARNAGINAATGEYVSFVDADDYIQPDMIKKMLMAAVKDNSEIVICGANVFPRDPAPDGWLDWVLSPENAYYETGDEKLLFENHASRPFIWRTFMKRELLTRNKFQLNEDIHVGEDNAFQFRIYPKAKGITLISDKLYNYRWYREDSLMNSIVYKNVEKKCLAHIKMVLHVAQEWIRSGDMKKMGKDFLRWSVEFLYDDFIKMPLNERAENAKLLTKVWTDGGFYKYEYSFPDHIRDMFKYFYTVAEEKPFKCDVSVIISADCDHTYFEQTIESCLGQDHKNFELIIINNGASASTYSVIHKYLHKDKRVRVYNTSKSHYTDGYNTGIGLSAGDYLLFVRPDDWLEDKNVLSEWLGTAKREKADVCLSLNKELDSMYYSGAPAKYDDNDSTYYLECVLGNAMFRKKFVVDKKLEFTDYSIESGKVFLSAACLTSGKIVVVDKPMYVSRNVYKQDWIPTGECVKVLKSFADRLELAQKYRSAELHNKIFSLLVSDYYMNLLINNTKPYFMTVQECPNGENSQSETFEQIIRILNLIDPQLLPKEDGISPTLPSFFAKFVDGRHKYIGDVSDEYLRV